MKKGVLRNFAKFTGKDLCQSVFFNNVAGLFSCEFFEISKNASFTEHICTTASDPFYFFTIYHHVFRQKFSSFHICLSEKHTLILNVTVPFLKSYRSSLGRCFFKQLFLKKLQYSQEYCEIFKDSFFIEHLRWLLLIIDLDSTKILENVIEAEK